MVTRNATQLKQVQLAVALPRFAVRTIIGEDNRWTLIATCNSWQEVRDVARRLAGLPVWAAACDTHDVLSFDVPEVL